MQTIQASRLDPLAHHTSQGGLPKLGGHVCVAVRISESEQCSLQTGYWPSLEVSVANYLNFLSGGGDTDKTLPLFCLCRSCYTLDHEGRDNNSTYCNLSEKQPVDLLRGA